MHSDPITFGNDAVRVVIAPDPDGAVYLAGIEAAGRALTVPAGQPLVEILTVDDGHWHPSERLSTSRIGRDMRYVSHRRDNAAGWSRLHLRMAEQTSGLEATVMLEAPDGIAAIRSSVTVTNGTAREHRLTSVTSLALRIPATASEGEPTTVDDLDVVQAAGDWLAENRWSRSPLRAHLPDLYLDATGQDARAGLIARSQGTWSTGQQQPTAALAAREDDFALIWQIEHNAGWRWEIGEDRDGVRVALGGPNDEDHQWMHTLEPGHSFTTVPATIAVGAGFDDAVGQLTRYRRSASRRHPDQNRVHVVYNDYMNTLMGNPTTEKLLPLIDAAATAGAEVFCIDAGWYDDEVDHSWWPTVGEWRPSKGRFPEGLKAVTGRIRERGMIPGLWLEPEVIGIESPMADRLPPEAFLSRGGVRICEAARYHLDFRHPAVTEHLDAVVDSLVADLGVGYFKFDYNINPWAGTDRDADSAGDGLLRHNRAHLAWLDSLLDRHPELILENCASGAMRMDFAMLSRMQLQSTSDQMDELKYPPIAASAPMAMVPEQAANWAYPSADMDTEHAAFTLATAVLGRFYLSGYLNRLDTTQTSLVHEAVAAHKDIRAGIQRSTPFWPLGLPSWEAPVVALALNAPPSSYLTVWHRHGAREGIDVPMPHLQGMDVEITTVFPRSLPAWENGWDTEGGVLTLRPPAVDSGDGSPVARTLKLTAR